MPIRFAAARAVVRATLLLLATLATLATLAAAALPALAAGPLVSTSDDPRLAAADAALRDGDASRARSLCESVLAERPSDVDALVLLGRAARRDGDLLPAEEWLEAALPGAAPADRARLAREMGLVRLARGQTLAIEGRGNRSTIVALFHDAIRALESARAGGLSDDEAVVALADAHDWAEAPDAAEKCLRDELARRPEAEAVRAALALHLLRREGREAEARDLALEVLERSPDRADVLMALGRMELLRGDVDRAFEAHERVLRAFPSLQSVYDDVWDATSSRRRFDLAERWLDRVAERFPGDAKAPYYRGHVRLLANRPSDAVADFSAALAADPALREARLGLAEARRRSGDRAGAATALREILGGNAADEGALDALRDLAEEIAVVGDDESARPLFEIVSVARPDDRTTRVNLAVACARTGRLEEARRVLSDGIARDPADSRLRNELGIVLEASRDVASAEREYRAALAVAWSFDAAENLAFLLLRAGRTDEALPLLAEILRRDPVRIRSAIAYERTARAR